VAMSGSAVWAEVGDRVASVNAENAQKSNRVRFIGWALV